MRGIVDTPERAAQLREAIGLLFELADAFDHARFHVQDVSGPPTVILKRVPVTKDIGTSRGAIVSALVSRAATTVKSIVSLVDLGHGSDALVLARGLFETAVTVVWILRDRHVRAYLFALTFAAARKHLADTWPTFFSDAGAMYSDDADRVRDDAVCAALFPNLRSTAWARTFDADGTMGDPLGLKRMLAELHGDDAKYGGLRYDLEYFSLSIEAHSQAMALFFATTQIQRSGVQAFSPRVDDHGRDDALFHAALNFYWVLGSVNQAYSIGEETQLAEIKNLINRLPDGAKPEPRQDGTARL